MSAAGSQRTHGRSARHFSTHNKCLAPLDLDLTGLALLLLLGSLVLGAQQAEAAGVTIEQQINLVDCPGTATVAQACTNNTSTDAPTTGGFGRIARDASQRRALRTTSGHLMTAWSSSKKIRTGVARNAASGPRKES